MDSYKYFLSKLHSLTCMYTSISSGRGLACQAKGPAWQVRPDLRPACQAGWPLAALVPSY